jgi:hypothetical protein
MTSEGRGILSPVRLPVPPLQQVLSSLELTNFLHRVAQVKAGVPVYQIPIYDVKSCCTFQKREQDSNEIGWLDHSISETNNRPKQPG